MKLNQLIEGSEQSRFILIHDNKDAKGEALLVEFIKKNVKLGNKTDLLCVERNSYVLRSLPIDTNLNVHFMSEMLVKMCEDPTDNINADPFKLFQEVQNRPKSHSKSILVIDSLSLLLLLHPEKFYRELHRLLHFNKSDGIQCQVICLLHDDVIPSGRKISLMYERLASTNIYISQQNKQLQTTTVHRKASGRTIEVVELLYFDQSLNLVTKEVVKVKESHSEDDNKDWMTKDVTFKLELEEKEKQARSELVLPYLKKQTEGTGEIYYEPDATDDWDEEDPDDDLDI